MPTVSVIRVLHVETLSACSSLTDLSGQGRCVYMYVVSLQTGVTVIVLDVVACVPAALARACAVGVAVVAMYMLLLFMAAVLPRL